MAAKYSSIPAVIDYLYTNITTAAANAVNAVEVVVADGYPGTEELPDIIAIGGTIIPVSDGEQKPGTLGARSFNEDYELKLTLSSYRGGQDEKTARDAAFALYDLVVGVLVADLTLGGACMWAIPSKLVIQGTNVDTAASGVTVDLDFSISVHQRISLLP